MEIDIERLTRDLTQNLKTQEKLDTLYQLMEDHNIDCMTNGRFQICVEMQYEEKTFTCILDTGAQQNVMNIACANRLGVLDMIDKNVNSIFAESVENNNRMDSCHIYQYQLEIIHVQRVSK